ncbi:MAG: cytochrome-c oxidase, cbb3-type subunit III [Steroidobacteraceae bacterium]|nr:cytochrome-c oxidase, cbb3-type subunit III [Steroidobacteraceae bacterium]
MSTFWSLWVMTLIVLNLGITLFLFVWAQKVDVPTQPDSTTGHVWAHGALREGVRKLPRWWVFLSACLFVWGASYLALYPGFGGAAGLLRWTSRAELERATAANDAKLSKLLHSFSDATPEQLAANPAARRYGERLFVDNCSACHQRDARGNPRLGAPNLVDGDWLYGGDTASITTSIMEGRQGVMPPLGAALDPTTLTNVVQYVLSLSGAPHDAAKAAAGQPSFALCAACHGIDGKGNPQLGAPNLTDSTWLYGGDAASIEYTIRNGRSGTMPAWKARLKPTEVRAIIAWLRSQSLGGDANAVVTAAAEPAHGGAER